MTTTSNHQAEHDRLARRRRYRRLFGGSVVAGVLGLLVAQRLGYPLVGVGLYWLGVLGMVAVWKLPSIELFDERERAIERRASHTTLNLFAVVLIALVPALTALEEVGVYEIPTMLSGAIWGHIALYVVFGVVYVGYRLRR